MASFEPVIILYGSPKIIANVNIKLPVSSLFAFDINALESHIKIPPQLSETCLKRYFIILFETIDNNFLKGLQSNHRIISIYHRDFISNYNQNELNQMINTCQQLTLDVTHDIIRFLTLEGEKQYKLDRIHLVKIYYQHARALKEWVMSSFKAEPCHILLIPLNSTLENLNNTQEKLQNICTELGYESTVIRQFNDYIPSNERHSSLLPYSHLLFNNENPKYICDLIKNLSSIRLYLYGNKLCQLNDWSKMMIENEKEIMNDEDSWNAFIENEIIDSDIKWNFAFIFGKQWNVSRVSPFNLNQLENDPRFQSALHRSHITYSLRQIEITSDLFDWYSKCIKQGAILLEPKLSEEQLEMKSKRRLFRRATLLSQCVFKNLCLFDYSKLNSKKNQSIKFVWLDEIINSSNKKFNEIIQPSKCEYFNNISLCISFIERELRENSYIFLIASGIFGEQLFSTMYTLMKQMFSVYIYCAQIQPNLTWSKTYSEIKGVYDDLTKLQQHIQQDYQQLQSSFNIIQNPNQICNKYEDTESLFSIPLTIYNPEQRDLFFAHQRTIDTLLCMPHTYESKNEMIEEFRRIYNDNGPILSEIDEFENNYHPAAAVRWYSKDSFVSRTINKVLRLSDVDQMFKFRHILIDIYEHLNHSSRQKHSSFYSYSFGKETYYRGQKITNEQFNCLKELRGNIISINTFFSTTSSMQVALMYAGQYSQNEDNVSIIFCIEGYPSSTQTRPYANISQYSSFPDEDETLFSMGSLFTVDNIRQLTNAENVWMVYLSMISENHYSFRQVSNDL